MECDVIFSLVIWYFVRVYVFFIRKKCSVENFTCFTVVYLQLQMSEPVDLSMDKNNMWLIVYFEGSNPGTECEILDKKEVVTSAEVLQRGDTVVVPYDGNVKTQGIVVSVSGKKIF